MKLNVRENESAGEAMIKRERERERERERKRLSVSGEENVCSKKK
jgi:hypothetical protein